MPRQPPTESRRASRRRSEEHTSELQSLTNFVCRLLLEKKHDVRVAGCLERPAAPPARRRRRRGVSRASVRSSRPSTKSAGNKSRAPSSFFFNDTATTEIYTLSLHDALPICYKLTAKFAGFGETIVSPIDL